MYVTEDSEKNLWYGECSCLQHWNHLFSWERITQTIGIPSRIQRSHNETNVRHICEIGVWTRWGLCSVNKWLGKLFMEVFVFDWWWTSHQSSAHTGLRFQILYCVLVRYTRTSNQTLHGNKDWRGFEWNIFPGFNMLQLSQEVQELLLRFNETTEFFRKDHLHVDVRRHLMKTERQQDRMRVKCSTRFCICKKIWSRTLVISRSWFRQRVVLCQWR